MDDALLSLAAQHYGLTPEQLHPLALGSTQHRRTRDARLYNNSVIPIASVIA